MFNQIRSIVNKINEFKHQANRNKDMPAKPPAMPIAAVSPHNGHNGHNGNGMLMVPNVPTVPNIHNGPSTPGTPNMANIPHVFHPSNGVPNASNGPNVSNSPMPNGSHAQASPHSLSKPSRAPLRNRAMSIHSSVVERSAAARLSDKRRQSICIDDIRKSRALNGVANEHTYAISRSPSVTTVHHRLSGPQMNPYAYNAHVQPSVSPPFMTKIHSPALMHELETPPKTPTPVSQSTLKVLSVDDVNSRKCPFNPFCV